MKMTMTRDRYGHTSIALENDIGDAVALDKTLKLYLQLNDWTDKFIKERIEVLGKEKEKAAALKTKSKSAANQKKSKKEEEVVADA